MTDELSKLINLAIGGSAGLAVCILIDKKRSKPNKKDQNVIQFRKRGV